MKMAIKKQFLKSKPVCKVTFTFDNPDFPDAKSVHIVGDFNEWSNSAHPMKRLKNGTFKLVVDLEVEKSYGFRYLVDGVSWTNDGEADKYVPSGMSSEENGIIAL